MIYLDSSAVLAHILSEARRPSLDLWEQRLFASRLLQFEVWNRLHAYRANAYRHGKARRLLKRVTYAEMTADVLVRALRPFEKPIRTLDALHLATMDHLRAKGLRTALASYDKELLAAATDLGFDTLRP